MWLSGKRPRLRFAVIVPSVLIAAILVATLIFIAGCANQPSANQSADAGKQGQPTPSSGVLNKVFDTTVAVPAGTPLRVTVDQTLTSDKNRAGDPFAASLSEPVEVNGKIVIPRGARVTGRVIGAKGSGRLHAPPQLSITLTSIEVGGNTIHSKRAQFLRLGKVMANATLSSSVVVAQPGP